MMTDLIQNIRGRKKNYINFTTSKLNYKLNYQFHTKGDPMYLILKKKNVFMNNTLNVGRYVDF